MIPEGSGEGTPRGGRTWRSQDGQGLASWGSGDMGTWSPGSLLPGPKTLREEGSHPPGHPELVGRPGRRLLKQPEVIGKEMLN